MLETQMGKDERRTCVVCGASIPSERIEALPYVKTCVDHSQETLRHDPEQVCFKSSPSGQNGFSPKS